MANQLRQAIQDGSYEASKTLLLAAPETVHLEEDGDTPLHVAARSGQAAIVGLLLEHGASINAQNQEGNTALHLAVMHLHELRGRMNNDEAASRTLISLLSYGPALGVENDEGQTAWDEAFGCDEEQVCFWIDEADRLQKAHQANIVKIHYTVSQTDEGPEVQDLEAFDQKGDSVALDPNEAASYQDYFLARRNWYGGLGKFDHTRPGDLVWDVTKKQVFTRFTIQPSVEPAPPSVAQAKSVADVILCLGTAEREKATEALLTAGEDAVVLLCEALKNPSWRVAAAAAHVLGKIGKTSAVEALLQTIEQKRFFVTEAAVWALGQIGDARCIDPIFDLLEDYNILWDVDVVDVGAGALSGFGLAALTRLGDFVSKPDDCYPQRAALALLSQVPDEPAIPLLISLLNCPDPYVFEGAEIALYRIGWPAARPLVESYLGGRIDEDAFFDAIINDPRVVDLILFEQTQSCDYWGSYRRAERGLLSLFRQTSESRCRMAERLLAVALHPRDDAENRLVWSVLDNTLDDIIWNRKATSGTGEGLQESLREILKNVVDKGEDDDCDEVLARSIIAVAALSRSEASPTALNSENSAPPRPSDEERIVAMLDGQNALLKPVDGLSAAAASAALYDQYQRTGDDPMEQMPLIKAMVYYGPEAIEALYELRDNYNDGTVPGFALKALEAINISALGADAVPPLLRALRQYSYPGEHERAEIWDHLVAIGLVGLPAIEQEMSLAEEHNSSASFSTGHIDPGTLANIREEIYQANG